MASNWVLGSPFVKCPPVDGQEDLMHFEAMPLVSPMEPLKK
jgi:hypothetical protein